MALLRLVAIAWTVVACAQWLVAVDAVPVVGPGATKEEVINAYGWPSGQSQSGTKEILTYPQGRITLEQGRVERMDFSPNVPWPAPRPRPGPPSPTSVKKVEAPTDFWVTNFEEAQAEAVRRHARILALFIGSDWSPPSKQFQDEVAFHPDFVNAFTGDFVFLRLDYPTRAPQLAELREQNNRLRAKYGVTTYPTLLVLSPAGSAVAQVDLMKEQAGDTYRDRMIGAVRAVRELLVARPPPPDPVPVAAVPAEPAPPAIPGEAVPNAGAASVGSAFSLVTGAIAVGLLLVAAALWWLWRAGGAEDPAKKTSMAVRISDAAGGLPTPAEIEGWPKEKLREVFSGLAESDSYEVSVRGGGGDGDLALTRKGDTKPSVIVCCHPAEAGPVSAKRLKELFGTITVEDIPKGWIVAPKGFSKEAGEYAAAHPLMLIDAEDLIEQMRAVPPISLAKILARTT